MKFALAPHPNAHLVGQADARAHLSTPALVLEKAAFEANVRAMAAFAADRGVKLRPHAKTHKSAEIARLQLGAGAIGICVAKLGEAEALHAAGIGPLLITSPIVSRPQLDRLARLHQDASDLLVVADSVDGAQGLADAAAGAAHPLNVLIDLDIGLHRTGIAPGPAALGLITFVMRHPALRFRGLQAYGGHLQHINDFAERRSKGLRALEPVAALRDQVAAKGIACEIISGSGTGTFAIDVEAQLFTELQVGSYVFMDREYNDVETGPQNRVDLQTSLFVETSVISANHPGIATTDAGLKSFATEAGPPPIHSGAPEGAKYFFFGDEQGGVLFAQPEHALKPGSRLRCVTPHCDPTVNLYSHYHVMDGDRLVSLWPVDARGRSA
ncbi:MAG TPA: threonine aldolase [Alphaproteobacteria bacterium]|nr:threonine aldolase [Alphaproteobacteria bacterium]HAJ48161.1 threonine aldolase [Alphaproteobacteria bacterium]